MKEHWIKDIHDRLGNYEMDAPDDLWTGISSNMPKVENGNSEKPKLRKAHNTIAMRSVAAACVAAACVAIFFYLSFSNSDDMSVVPTAKQLASASKEDNASNVADGFTSPIIAYTSTSTSTKQNTNDIMDEYPSEATTEGNDTIVAPIVVDVDSVSVDCSADEHIDKQPHTTSHLIAIHNTHSSLGKSHWSISTAAMGAMGSSSTATSIAEPIVAAGPEGVEWQDNPMLGLGVYNQGQNVSTDIKHHQPVRIGINVAYAVNDKISVEGGLSYTWLSSDVREGTTDNYWYGYQQLHYVGIPVNLKYRLFASRHLGVYASAGMLTEKCVAGNTSRNYVMKGQRETSESLSVGSKPFQLSANAAVGIQVSIADNIGIYAEPGLSYYFDDNSSLSTIYKDKPLNFNLNVGLRYTINK